MTGSRSVGDTASTERRGVPAGVSTQQATGTRAGSLCRRSPHFLAPTSLGVKARVLSMVPQALYSRPVSSRPVSPSSHRAACCSLKTRHADHSGLCTCSPAGSSFSILFNAVPLAPGLCLAHSRHSADTC